MTAFQFWCRGGVDALERGSGTSREGTDVWLGSRLFEGGREGGRCGNFIADPTQIYLRHDAYRQHVQNHSHTCAHQNGSNEQIVRRPVAGTELQDQVHPVGTGEDSGCDAADQGGRISAFYFGGGFELEVLEACSVRWVGGCGLVG